MATQLPTQQEIYDLFKNEVQARNPLLTDFEEGSNLDALAGATSVSAQQILAIIIEKFNKTFIETSHGPEVTGGDDDLQALVTDHFGASFARPGATSSVTTVTFTRPTFGAGAVLIPGGTIVKTDKDSNGNEQRYQTDSDVTMGAASLTAASSVTAIEAGADGNVQAGTIINIESSLTDPTIAVNNLDASTGGDDDTSDAEYREFIRNNIEIIRGATQAAIEAAALNVPGVEIATAIEFLQTVIEWDIGGGVPIGDEFNIPRKKLYVADANGTASDALIEDVEEAVAPVRACGVRIDVIGATPISLDWGGSVTLNPSGPNYLVLSSDLEDIEETMSQYLQELPIGTGFDRGLAKLAIMAVWGPSGTNDITDFVTNSPTGSVSATAIQKIIPGTMELS